MSTVCERKKKNRSGQDSRSFLFNSKFQEVSTVSALIGIGVTGDAEPFFASAFCNLSKPIDGLVLLFSATFPYYKMQFASAKLNIQNRSLICTGVYYILCCTKIMHGATSCPMADQFVIPLFGHHIKSKK